MKDLNFLEIKNDKKKIIRLNDYQLSQINETLSKDCEFLSNYGLMDYSLLMVIETKVLQKQISINDSKSVAYEKYRYHVH